MIYLPHSFSLGTESEILLWSRLLIYLPHSFSLGTESEILLWSRLLKYLPHSFSLGTESEILLWSRLIKYLPHSFSLGTDKPYYHYIDVHISHCRASVVKMTHSFIQGMQLVHADVSQ